MFWRRAVTVAGLMCLAAGVGVGVHAKKIELNIWDWDSNRAGVLKPWAAEYMKLHPEVNITTTAQGFGDYPDKLLAAVIGGSPPPIVAFHNSWTGHLVKMLAPFPEYLFPMSKMADEFYQFNTAARMPDGHFYFFPDGLMTGIMWYNKRLWNQAGLASLPKTWDEVRLAAKKMTVKNGDGKIDIAGFNFAGDLVFDDLNYQLGSGLYNEAHTGVTWDTPEGRKAIELVSQMMFKDGIWNSSSGFEQNKAGIQYNWGWLKASVVKTNPAKLPWGVFELPTATGGDTDIRGRTNFESGYSVTANTKADVKDAAFKFLAWLYGNDKYYLKVNDVMGRVPGKKSMWLAKEIVDDPVQSVVAKQIAYTVFPGERPAWVDTQLQAMVGGMQLHKWDGPEGLRRAQAAADKQWKVTPPKWIVEHRLPVK